MNDTGLSEKLKNAIYEAVFDIFNCEIPLDDPSETSRLMIEKIERMVS